MPTHARSQQLYRWLTAKSLITLRRFVVESLAGWPTERKTKGEVVRTRTGDRDKQEAVWTKTCRRKQEENKTSEKRAHYAPSSGAERARKGGTSNKCSVSLEFKIPSSTQKRTWCHWRAGFELRKSDWMIIGRSGREVVSDGENNQEHRTYQLEAISGALCPQDPALEMAVRRHTMATAGRNDRSGGAAEVYRLLGISYAQTEHDELMVRAIRMRTQNRKSNKCPLKLPQGRGLK
ncbi:hypothetical protein K438DRAFT_1786540 [Mycena galopus ATCC 62051]|nr:hypothetical protein K438DRAFT_1786540 [Mycena galopus ATCC 62051]